MSSKLVIQEGARALPVATGWAAIIGAEPTTQVTLVAGLLTCLYLIAQLWLIHRRARIERRKLEMAEREHSDLREKHQALMQSIREGGSRWD